MVHLLTLLTLSPAEAHVIGFHDWPQHREALEDIAYWAYEDGWYISPVRETQYSGTRVGLFIEKSSELDIDIEARWVSDTEKGQWMRLQNTFALPTLELWNQDFDQATRAIQFRTKQPSSMEYIEWDLLHPLDEYDYRDNSEEDTGFFTPLVPSYPPPASTYLSSALVDLGVIARTDWGSATTGCTTPENDWYRMAVHHVASSQTYNGTIEARVQALQAWAMSTGGFCDIPYQYLVGYDGTLWEARPINRYSGATGGGQNDGNIAVSFIGCYDQSACMSSYGFYDTPTDIMMARARELIQTLSDEHEIDIDQANIKMHRDWPGNSTACPGAGIVNRFGELINPNAYYHAKVVGKSHDEAISLYEGETVDVWVDVQNLGMWDWDADTKLAPTPRDTPSVMSDTSWADTTRVQAVQSTVSTNDTYRFNFTLHGSQVGTFAQDFSMMQEGVTWFADTPYGGSFPDDAILFTVDVETNPNVEPSSEPSDDPDIEVSTEPLANAAPFADAGADQTVVMGKTVVLDGSRTFDPDGRPIQYSWSFVTPSTMTLTDATTLTPSFVATELGNVQLQLEVQDIDKYSNDVVLISVIEVDDEEEEEDSKRGCSQNGSYSTGLWGLLTISLLTVRRRKTYRFN